MISISLMCSWKLWMQFSAGAAISSKDFALIAFGWIITLDYFHRHLDLIIASRLLFIFIIAFGSLPAQWNKNHHKHYLAHHVNSICTGVFARCVLWIIKHLAPMLRGELCLATRLIFKPNFYSNETSTKAQKQSGKTITAFCHPKGI
jgi:hypothetical protein